jgi:hypothetical protein
LGLEPLAKGPLGKQQQTKKKVRIFEQQKKL